MTEREPARTVVHCNGTVQRFFEGCWVETELPGLPLVVAVPRPDQIRLCDELGYGDDLEAMTWDHDFLHAWLADVLGLDVSFSLARAAGAAIAPPGIAEAEEAAVLALQRFVRLAGVKPHDLAPSISI